MSSNPGIGPQSSTSNDTSTLRPRTARLISYLDEGGDDLASTGGGHAISTSSSALGRSSPSSSLRNVTAPRRYGKNSGQSDTVVGDDDTPRRGSGANGLWDSWTQIQGIASTFLGSDASATVPGPNTKPTRSLRTPAWMKQERSHGSPKQTQKWGPRAPDKIGIGPGSIEERQAMLQAKKREALLLAATDEGRDASGRFKRKGSNASLNRQSSTTSDDVLVYRHKVLPGDTMAGVTIKYSCQQEVFRKVNRLWPNDRIQIREYVLLPVDACAIRGRKVDRPDDVDLLGGDPARSQVSKGHQNSSVNGTEEVVSSMDTTSVPSSVLSSVIDEQDEEYKHDSWVSLPKFPRAVEILRIPRTTLGYFPPARRKSNHNLFTSGIESATSSPRSSLDTLRHPPTHAAQQAQLQYQTLRSVSVESPLHQSSSISSRNRSHSTATTSSQRTNAASNAFFSALRGPGGVGSLRGLRTESSRPGPADDPLNQNFAKYLPSLALTAAPGDLQTLNDDQRKSFARAYSSAQTLGLPRASMDSSRSSRSGRSNSSTSAFGVGVENWVKKITSATAGAARPNLSRTNSDRTIGPSSKLTGIGIGIGGETGLGDLIELETNHDTRHFLPDPDHFEQTQDDPGIGDDTPKLGTLSSHPRRLGASAQAEQDTQLNERFPVRGKVTEAYGAKK